MIDFLVIHERTKVKKKNTAILKSSIVRVATDWPEALHSVIKGPADSRPAFVAWHITCVHVTGQSRKWSALMEMEEVVLCIALVLRPSSSHLLTYCFNKRICCHQRQDGWADSIGFKSKSYPGWPIRKCKDSYLRSPLKVSTADRLNLFSSFPSLQRL